MLHSLIMSFININNPTATAHAGHMDATEYSSQRLLRLVGPRPAVDCYADGVGSIPTEC